MNWRDILNIPKEQELKKLKKLIPVKEEEVSQVLDSGNCGNCKKHEHIPGLGSGCVRQLSADHIYSEEWLLLDLLATCPEGYWK